MAEGEKILVVEDDGDIRGAIAAYLEGAGYRVVEAEDGADALRLLRAADGFCLILLDLFMPVMNGWAFRSEQMSDPDLARIPVVVLSADVGAPKKAAQIGAAGWMTKPFSFERLLQVVAQHC
jgi:CheY-like chemotaxis protein